MHQPYPSSGEPRPLAPAPVRTAVKLMYGGAVVSAIGLVIGLALIIADIETAGRGRFLGHSLTAPQMRPLIITVWIIFGLVGIALWLWMARANGQGQNWARILSTALFGLATLQLRHPQPQGSPTGFGMAVLYYGGTALFAAAWLVGAAAVWLLWRPASGVFFRKGSRPRWHAAA